MPYSCLNFLQNQEELPYRFLHLFHHGEIHFLKQTVVNSNKKELHCCEYIFFSHCYVCGGDNFMIWELKI